MVIRGELLAFDRQSYTSRIFLAVEFCTRWRVINLSPYDIVHSKIIHFALFT